MYNSHVSGQLYVDGDINLFLKYIEELHEFEYDLENGNLNEVEQVLKTGK